MRVLLDEQIPVDLATELVGHEVSSVTGVGWQSITNGELLLRATGRFDVLVTMDRNLQFQQNLAAAGVGIVLIRAASNRMRDLRPLIPEILQSLSGLRAGEVRQVGAHP